jgi:hypothetical protein
MGDKMITITKVSEDQELDLDVLEKKLKLYLENKTLGDTVMVSTRLISNMLRTIQELRDESNFSERVIAAVSRHVGNTDLKEEPTAASIESALQEHNQEFDAVDRRLSLALKMLGISKQDGDEFIQDRMDFAADAIAIEKRPVFVLARMVTRLSDLASRSVSSNVRAAAGEVFAEIKSLEASDIMERAEEACSKLLAAAIADADPRSIAIICSRGRLVAPKWNPFAEIVTQNAPTSSASQF